MLEALLCNRAACNLELSEHFSCRSLTSLLISWRRKLRFCIARLFEGYQHKPEVL